MEKYKNEMIDTIMKAISFNTIEAEPENGAPFGKGCLDCLEYVLEKCREFGMTTKNLDGYCGYADIGEGEPFGIIGHLDCVPLGKGWTKKPFGEIDNGVIYGRGIMDDKGPMISCVYAIKALLDEGYKPKRKIRLIFGCNEESGWECVKHYNKVEKMPETGFSPDADFPVINCEKGIVNYRLSKTYDGIKINAGERANVVPNECSAVLPNTETNLNAIKNSGLKYTLENNKIYISASGKSAHAATPFEGDNAIIKMLKALSPLDNDFKKIYDAFYSCMGEGCGLNLSDEQSGKLTVNLGVINSDDGKLEFMLDIRYPVSIPESQILSILKQKFGDYKITRPHFHDPLFVDKNDELVQTLLATYNKVTGENAEPISIGGGTYARAMKKGVGFGPEFPGVKSTIHQPDECVSIETLMKFTQIYYEAIKSLCFE